MGFQSISEIPDRESGPTAKPQLKGSDRGEEEKQSCSVGSDSQKSSGRTQGQSKRQRERDALCVGDCRFWVLGTHREQNCVLLAGLERQWKE